MIRQVQNPLGQPPSYMLGCSVTSTPCTHLPDTKMCYLCIRYAVEHCTVVVPYITLGRLPKTSVASQPLVASLTLSCIGQQWSSPGGHAWGLPEGNYAHHQCRVLADVCEPCRCTGQGCKFVGSPSEFATHVLHNATNCTRRVWLCDYNISLKVCTVPKLPCALTTSFHVADMTECKPSLCSARAARETDWRLVGADTQTSTSHHS
jgi:hypothetical protein